MSQKTVKIYDSDQFDIICKGIKVADCMKNSDAYQQDAEQTLLQLQTLSVSESLFCSFCKETFNDVSDQRSHYKLEWHRYNLKRKLIGKRPLSKVLFDNKLEYSKGNISSSNSEAEPELSANSENENELENEENSSGSESESSEQYDKNQQLVLLATKYCQVFFSNDYNDLFSIYRCLLHKKKMMPSDDELVEAVQHWQKNCQIAIMLVGGGHFAGAVFKGKEALVHKTFHCYTVRQGQGGAQGVRDNKGNAPKSAGASLRRYNEAALVQHVQGITVTWEQELQDCHVILYRASGPYNRQVLFGGKTPAMNKSDPRLRPIPFPTKRATFNEVKRVYDIITTIDMNKNIEACILPKPRDDSPKSNVPQERRSKSISPKKSNTNRAKSREIPQRPLPCNLSESESEEEANKNTEIHLQNQELNLKNALEEYDNSLAFDAKVKKKTKRKSKPSKPKIEINEIYQDIKQKLFGAIKLADVELLKSTLNEIIAAIDSENNSSTTISDKKIFLWTKDELIKLLNDATNCNKNTLLHLASSAEQCDMVSELLKAGSDPCIKNVQGKTPYCMTDNTDVRQVFKTFRAENPDKFNYAKSHIPEILGEDAALERAEKRREIKRAKRERERIKKKEEAERKFDEDERVRFLHLSDREKRALAAERRILANPAVTSSGAVVLTRCFTCGIDISGKVPFEYSQNRFCSMDCLKAHRMSKPLVLS